jgi:hypothetical protein
MREDLAGWVDPARKTDAASVPFAIFERRYRGNRDVAQRGTVRTQFIQTGVVIQDHPPPRFPEPAAGMSLASLVQTGCCNEQPAGRVSGFHSDDTPLHARASDLPGNLPRGLSGVQESNAAACGSCIRDGGLFSFNH